MERLYSEIAKGYSSNISYLPKVLLQLVDTEGLMVEWCGVGVGELFLVISRPKVSKYVIFEKCHFLKDTALNTPQYTKEKERKCLNPILATTKSTHEKDKHIRK